MGKMIPKINDNIADTLFITVYMRALDAQRKRPILGDKRSLELIEQIDYPFEKYSGVTTMSRIGTCVRLKYLDEQVEEFIDSNKNVVVVNIGCGLDDRYSRVRNASKATFYELDLPECIELREQLIPAHSNQFLIPGSAFESGWLQELREKHPDGNFIFVAEGVFMYFPECEINRLLCYITGSFPNARIMFDVPSRKLSLHSDKHDTLRNAKAGFAWGIDDIHIFEKWHPGLKLDKVFYVMHGMRRYNFLLRIISYIPAFGKGFKVISLKVSGLWGLKCLLFSFF